MDPKCEYCGGPVCDRTGCKRCKKVYYCSTHCARSDWPRHMMSCAPLVEGAKDTAAQDVNVRIGPVVIGKDTYNHLLGELFSTLVDDAVGHSSANGAKVSHSEKKVLDVVRGLSKKLSGHSYEEVSTVVMAIHAANRSGDRAALEKNLTSFLTMLFQNYQTSVYSVPGGVKEIANALLSRNKRAAKTQGLTLGSVLDKHN